MLSETLGKRLYSGTFPPGATLSPPLHYLRRQHQLWSGVTNFSHPIWVLSERAYVSNRISSDWGERCKWPARRLRQQLDVLRRHSKVAPMWDRTASANQLPPPTRLQKLENAFERCRKFAINMLPICASGLIAYAAIAEVRGCWVEVATTWIG